MKHGKILDQLVHRFYTKVISDDIIGYIFQNVEGFSFETHMPVMIAFWETLLLGVASYKGNPMLRHIELNKLIPLNDDHFTRWLSLWEETVKENFEGPRATEAISKAKSIAGIMKIKIAGANTGIVIDRK